MAVLSGEEKAKSSVERQQQAKYTVRVYSLETCNLGVFIRENRLQDPSHKSVQCYMVQMHPFLAHTQRKWSQHVRGMATHQGLSQY